MREFNSQLSQLVSQANAHYSTGPAELLRGKAKLSTALAHGADAGSSVEPGRGFSPSHLRMLSWAALGGLALVLSLWLTQGTVPNSAPTSEQRSVQTTAIEPVAVASPAPAVSPAPEALRVAIEKAVRGEKAVSQLPVSRAAPTFTAKVTLSRKPKQAPKAKRKPRRAPKLKRRTVSRKGGIRDAEYMPIFRTKPMYPRRAHHRELEGWVDVRYLVNRLGKIENAEVVDADPPWVFNRAALACVKRWKYRPKMRDGRTVDTPGVETRISFTLRDTK